MLFLHLIRKLKSAGIAQEPFLNELFGSWRISHVNSWLLIWRLSYPGGIRKPLYTLPLEGRLENCPTSHLTLSQEPIFGLRSEPLYSLGSCHIWIVQATQSRDSKNIASSMALKWIVQLLTSPELFYRKINEVRGPGSNSPNLFIIYSIYFFEHFIYTYNMLWSYLLHFPFPTFSSPPHPLANLIIN